MSAALADVGRFNKHGLSCSLSYLPIRSMDEESVHEQVSEYLKALKEIRQERLHSDITIKMHQFGIYMESRVAEAATLEIVKSAQKQGSFVWIDMEQPSTVDQTLAIHALASARYDNVGICLQAYLTRTEQDLHRVLKSGSAVRLVKGFYRRHDVSSWREVTRNYRRLMFRVLRESRLPAIATHDENLIEEAKRFIVENRIETAELQFFAGVRDSLARRLQQQGFATRVYVPYGDVMRYWMDGLRTFDIRRQLQRLVGFRPLP